MAIYPIREVSRITGIKCVTLRAWERRYGLLSPERTRKGHRLYSRYDIERVEKIVDLINRGIPVGRTGWVLDNGLSEAPRVKRRRDRDDASVVEWKRSLLTASEDLSQNRLQQVLEEVLSHYPLDAAWRDILEPTRERVRRLSARMQMNSIAKGMYETVMERALTAKLHQSLMELGGIPVWITGLPGDWDRILPVIYALIMIEVGFAPTILGGRISLNDLSAILERRNKESVLIIASQQPQDPISERGIRTLGTMGLAWLGVSGMAAVTKRAYWEAENFQILPPDPVAAVQEMTKAFR